MIDQTQRDALMKLVGGAANVSVENDRDTAVVLTLKDQGLVDVEGIRALGFAKSVSLKAGTLRIGLTDQKGQDMAGKYHDLAAEILKGVGGLDNVNSLTHCITRLRFKLKDESIAGDDTIGALDGVIQVMHAGGQYQVVVGAKVDEVYDELVGAFGVPAAGEVPADEDEAPAGDGEKGGILSMLMDTISGCMGPILMPLAAAGMIKGLLALATSMGWLAATDGTYQVWYAIADGFFYFLPIILGYTSAKKFGLNEFVGMAIGAALVYPTMVNLTTTNEVMGTLFAGTAFEMSYYSTFLGIPVVMPAAGYTASVIPILLATFVASKLERALKKVIPDLIRNFFVPVVVFAIMAPLTYLVIGPVASLISGVLTLVVSTLYSLPLVGPALCGLVVGGLWSTLVMFGLHWSVVPVMLNNLATLGFDPVNAVVTIGGFIGISQGLSVILRTHDNKLRNVAIPATISQIFGVGEPILYGVQLPKKFLFFQNIAFSAIGGLIMGALNVKTFMMGGMGIFSFPSYIDQATNDISSMISYAIVLVVMMVVSFAFTMATYHDDGCYFGKKKEAAK